MIIWPIIEQSLYTWYWSYNWAIHWL